MAAKKKRAEKEEAAKASPPKTVEEKTDKGEGKDQPKRGLPIGKLRKVAFPLIMVLVSYIVVTKVVSPKLMGEKKALEEQRKKAELKKEEAPQKKPKADMIGQIYAVSDIIVNPAGSSGERFVKVSIGLEMKDAKLGDELTKRDVQLRDIFIGIFTSKTVEELTNPDKRENLREEVKTKINSLLVSGEIKNVYFTDLVIQ